MGELGLNKIFGALLAVALVIMGLREVSTMVFGGGHHGGHEYASLNEWAEDSFHGYHITLTESGGSAEVIEEVYDLGLLLARADASRGERSFKSKCASCHTVDQGGANSTGPNLYAKLGGAKESHPSFAYSGALSSTEGDWTYANMDAWLESPSKYARGTSMGFAGLKRDDERANVIAYLASFTPNAPAFPEPLPVVEAPAEGLLEGDAETLVEGPVEPIPVDDTVTIAPDANDPVIESVDETVDQVIEDVTDTVEDVIEEVTETPNEH